MDRIQLYSISKVYREKEDSIPIISLNNVTISFSTKKIYAIMGPSGSGKSTLMHIIGLLDRPTKGKYFLNGKDVSSLSDFELAQLRNREFGFVFQSYNLLPKYSVIKNIELPLIYSKKYHLDRVSKNKILEIVETVGLSERLLHIPNQLSGGEKQRVAIARALINNPGIILADEPTGNLDSKTEKEILNLIISLKSPERTIIIVTHNNSVAKIADKVIFIKDGKVKA